MKEKCAQRMSWLQVLLLALAVLIWPICHLDPSCLCICAQCLAGQSTLPGTCGQSAQPMALGASPTGANNNSRVATNSSVLVLRWLNSLAALMPLLPASQAALWAAVAELFDNFLLACFILFSGVSLEALVWQDDLLPLRLRSALLGITTSPGCKYKMQVGNSPASWHHPAC